VAALRHPQTTVEERTATMLWTIAIILVILWGLGLVTATTMGGFIHILLVLALVVVLVRVIQGRKAIP
jgi:hypothetical protein